MSLALDVHGLWKAYTVGMRGCSARVQVLRGVQLQVARGERVGILGGAASGKTTLVHCLAGLRRPDAGHIRLCDGAEGVALVDEGRPVGPVPRGAAATVIVGRELAVLRDCVDRVVVLRDGRIAPVDAETFGRRVAEPGRGR